MGAVANATPAGGLMRQKLRQAEAMRAEQEKLIPAPPPDLTDEAVRAASLQGTGAVGQGRKSTFLSGAGGFGAPTTKRKTLLGGG